MKDIRVVFMGTPSFACGILDTLHDEGYNVVAVCSQPDKKVGRKQLIQATPVKQRAIEYGIDVVQPVNIKTDFGEVLAYKPDLIVTCAYGQIVPVELLNYPKYGCINVHASLLPKYRGGAPIHMSVINGEKKTGITIMYMVKKMDAGDIICQDEVEILENDTTGLMYDKLEVCGKNLLAKMLPDFLAGNLKPIKQDEELVTFAPNISKEQEFISFNRDVNVVYNHIRGLIDWPVGYGIINGKKIKIHAARKLVKNISDKPGTVVGMKDNGLAVACIDGYILLDEVQVEGKQKTSIKDFYNGMGRNLIGAEFENEN